jgi:hypothetical protein
MIVFAANNKEYSCPETLADVTLSDYIRYLELLKELPKGLKDAAETYTKLQDDFLAENERAYLEKRLQNIEKACTIGKHKAETTKYKIKVVSHFTKLPIELMQGRRGIDIDSLNQLYEIIVFALEYNNSDDFSNEVEFEGETYFVSDVKKITLGEFLEAAQLEEVAISQKKNYAESLLDVVSVLLRKKDEDFSEAVYLRNKEQFLRLDMDSVKSVGFFLSKKNRILLSDASVFLAVQQLIEIKEARARWYEDLSGTSY